MKTVEIFAPPSLASLTAKAFAVNSDTVAYTAASVTEQTAEKGAYLVEFTTMAVGAYLIVLYSSGTAEAAMYVYAGSGTGVFRCGSYADTVAAMQVEIVRAIKANKTTTDPVSGVMTVYADDGATPLFTAEMFEDAAETQPYRGRGAEVRGRLA